MVRASFRNQPQKINLRTQDKIKINQDNKILIAAIAAP